MFVPKYIDFKHSAKQWAFENSTARFVVAPCGRRSGKTAIAKRKLVKEALCAKPGAQFFAAAPTRDQAKRIFWDDLKAMIPLSLIVARRPREGELILPLFNGARICVVGMDAPERIEGAPWNGGVLDEYGNMHADVWEKHIRAALTDRLGWCWFIGVPEGRNHYYKLFCDAESKKRAWACFTWTTADVLPLYLGAEVAAQEIADARASMDEITFRQEYNAEFVNFAGRAYYAFDRVIHTGDVRYDPSMPLVFCFDFNVSPGVAAVAQEQYYKEVLSTVVIGEAYIPKNSNTPLICRELLKKYSAHKGDVYCYGDATGGASGTAKISGTDWDLIKQTLFPAFGDRLKFRVSPGNPRERVRVNAVNTRLQSVDGTVRLIVNPVNAPHVVTDFEAVILDTGGGGEIDKTIDPNATHLTDALGYYISAKHPLNKGFSGARIM